MLLKAIKWFLTTLTVPIALALLIELLKRLLFPTPTQNWTPPRWLILPHFVQKHEIVACLAIVAALGILTFLAFHSDRLKQLRDKVAFYRSTNRLRPTDINPGRAWYEPLFLWRDEVGQAVELLKRGEGVIFVGDPLLGKTRCAYEALKLLPRHYVLGLIPEEQDVGNLKIPRSYGLFRPRLIVFLDDLQRYLAKISPNLLLQKLQLQVKSVAVLATCRTGEELLGVQKDPSFGPFLNQSLRQVEPGKLSQTEAQDLAVRLGKDWDEKMYNGTPGTVVFGLGSMRARLDTMSVDARRLMWSLFLMSETGIETYRSVLTEAVAKTIYGLESSQAEIDEAWMSLKRNGFLTIDKGLIVPTHRIYIEHSFASIEYGIADTQERRDNLWKLISEAGEKREILEMGVTWLRRSDFPHAEQAFRKYLEFAFDDARAHTYLGVTLVKQGRHEDAEKMYREATRINPKYAAAYFGLGDVLRELRRHGESEMAYREAIKIDPKYVHAYNNLGDVLRDLGRRGEAEEAYREAIAIDPEYAYSHVGLGDVLRDLGRRDEAEEAYREAIAIDSKYAYPHVCLGNVLRDLGRWDEAEKAYREAIGIGPEYAYSRVCLGNVLRDQGRWDEAEKAYREAIAIDSKYAYPHNSLGLLLDHLERNKEAQAQFEEAIQIDPNFAGAYYNLGLLHTKLRRNDEAEKAYREAINIDPKYVDAHNNLGNVLGYLGRWGEAEKSYREAIRIDPKHAAAHNNLGVLLDHLERNKEAEAEFEEAIQIDPNFASAHKNLGLLYTKLRPKGQS